MVGTHPALVYVCALFFPGRITCKSSRYGKGEMYVATILCKIHELYPSGCNYILNNYLVLSISFETLFV